MKKVKIIISAILITGLSMSLIGCGKDNAETKSGDTTTEQSTKADTKTTDDKHDFQKDPSLPLTLSVELDTQKYSVDYPWGIASARSGAFSDTEGMYVIYDQFVPNLSDVDYGVDPTKITKADQVIEGMKDQFKNTAASKLPLSKAESYKITKKENVTINDWDMCRYEGEFTLKDTAIITLKDKKAPFVAYGVIKDAHPVYFIVVDESDNHDNIKEIGVLADKIAKTFRDLDKE
ncbi:hypothetical protein [Clostridium lacusfryxellense]|uniref:hypothetical protein n=1 Tax=Clostridium lacusfryxellense TaxID=205328 RepID=UPI001C0BD175|nr:hypothetical protein [Clostridium lacusfryxellense]MBU3112344.1 hypothetical protein [Clostridium lacusfryxellense]